MIIPKMNISGKSEIIKILEQQEQQAAAMQQEQAQVQHAFEHAKMQELMSRAVTNISIARERHGRAESNLGLYEERLSMIERNNALTLKEKQAALNQLLESIKKYGEIETAYADNKLRIEANEIDFDTEREKQDVHRRSESNKFLMEIMQGLPDPIQQVQNQQMQGQEQSPLQMQM